MIEKINICTMRTLSTRPTELVLSKEKFLNTRVLNSNRAQILSSKDIAADVSGAIVSGDNCFMGFNISPNVFVSGYNYVTDVLSENIQKVLDMGKNVQGFICGGLSNSLETKSATASYALYNEVAEMLDQFGIQFGMICGKNKANSFDNIRIHKDKIFMWGDYLHDCFTQKTKKPMTRDNITDFYQDVIMPEGMTFNLLYEPK